MKRRKLTKKGYLLCVCFVLGILVLVFFFFWMTPKMKMHGEEKLTINLNSKYQEKGVEAVFQGKSITKEVETEGKVNTKKEGTYKITYHVKKGLFESTLTRTVIVKDIEKPKIELVGDQKIYLCKDGTFEELGFTATDNVDGDLTKKVKRKQEKDQVIYTVKDHEGNERKVIRKLIYEDRTPPVITLTGGEITSVYLNEPYQELGYTATDNCDHDLTEKVRVSGNVDTSQLASYELTYEVVDEAGNKGTAKRTVHVVEHTKNGTIFLTFDDGPKEGTTNVILDILKEEGVKATFFVTNGGPDYLIQREANEGHTVALHTASHNYQTVYTSVEGYFNDLQIVHDRVQRLTGLDARIIRFPGGSSNTVSRRYNVGIMSTLTREVLLRGYRYYDWNLSSGDAGDTTESQGVYQNVIHNLSKNRVNMILMHDIKPYTRDALRDIIRYGKNNGYTFEKIDMNTEMVTQRVNN